MTLVYSSEKTEIKGVHCNPYFFQDVNKKASLIYTDDEKIKKAYDDVDIKVLPLTTTKAKKETKRKR